MYIEIQTSYEGLEYLEHEAYFDSIPEAIDYLIKLKKEEEENGN